MPSKVLEEFLKRASPEAKAGLQQIGQELQSNGVKDTAPEKPEPTPTVAERTDVKQIGQDLQRNGAELKSDTYGPQTPARIGESRPHAETPTFMDEQKPGQQAMTPDQKAALQHQELKTERSGQQNQRQENAMDRATASSQKAPEPPKSQDKQKSQEIER